MKEFRELDTILNLSEIKDPLVKVETLRTIPFKDSEFPLTAFIIGESDPDKDIPTFAIFAGVHGLEKVGTHLALTYLQYIFNKLSWDEEYRKSFQDMRLLFFPLINPTGMYQLTRSNSNGVDLMRNSPVKTDHKAPFLLSGHRISNKLPWYQGANENILELETMTVIEFCQKYLLKNSFSMSIDLHSGFGMQDRIWYPYAYSKNSFPFENNIQRLKSLLEKMNPFHIYKIEKQSESYTTNGDLWDHLFLNEFLPIKNTNGENKIFIPLTLELGSWAWAKKNPLQVFSKTGLFNPIKKHRYNRVMRRHLFLFDFLIQATRNNNYWN